MKKLIAALVLALSVSSSGCLGPDKTFTGLHEWNQQVSDKDWLNEAVFIGFHIIPVYEFTYFLDVFILNVVDYWGSED